MYELVQIRQKMRKLWFSYGKPHPEEQLKSLLHLDGIDPDNFKSENCLDEVYAKYFYWETPAQQFRKLKGIENKFGVKLF